MPYEAWPLTTPETRATIAQSSIEKGIPGLQKVIQIHGSTGTCREDARPTLDVTERFPQRPYRTIVQDITGSPNEKLRVSRSGSPPR